MALSGWSTTAASNSNAATGVNFDEGQLAGTVNNSARELMAQVRAAFEDAEFFNYGHTYTFASSTSVTVAGDITGTHRTGRAVRVVGAVTGEIYGIITASSFGGANTTLTFNFFSGSMSSEALTVSVGILNFLNRFIASGQYWFTTDTGAANAYVGNPTPAALGLEKGQRAIMAAVNANSGASTLNWSGIGATSIRDTYGNALPDGAIAAGQLFESIFDGTNWRTHLERPRPQVFAVTARTEVNGAEPLTLLSQAFTKISDGPMLIKVTMGIRVHASATNLPAYFDLEIGGTSAGRIVRPFMPNLATMAGDFFNLELCGLFSNVSSGARTVAIRAGNAGGGAMRLIANPNSADGATLPASTTTTFLIEEL